MSDSGRSLFEEVGFLVMNYKILFLHEFKKFHFHSEGIKPPMSKQKSCVAIETSFSQ
jgi:hypothetical protein